MWICVWRRLHCAALLACLSYGHMAYATEVVISHERSGDLIWMNQQGQAQERQALCNRPRGLALHTNLGRLYVACSDDDKVLELDISSRSVIRQFEGLEGAMSLAVFPDQNRLLVSNEGAAKATVVDLSNGAVLALLATGFEPDGVAVSKSTGQLFVASETNGLVHVFDADSYQQVAVIRTHLRPRRLALDEARDELWISSEMGSRVEIFSLQSLTKIDEIVFAPRGFRPEQMTPVDILLPRGTPDAYVALGSANNIAIIDRVTREIKDYVLVGRRAWGLGYSATHELLFVLNGLSDDMTIIDLSTNRPTRTVRIGLVPHAVAVIE